MTTRWRQFWIGNHLCRSGLKIIFRIGFPLSQVHQKLCEDNHTFDKPFEKINWNLQMGWSMRSGLWNLERHFGENTCVEITWLWQRFWDPFWCFQLCDWKSPNARWKAGGIWEQKISETERRWPTHEKEMWAMIHCLKTWGHYIGSKDVVVWIDNVTLKYFATQPKLSSKQLKWQDTFVNK